MTPLLTVAAFRAKHTHLFHRNQDWFAGERFMEAIVPDREMDAPSFVIAAGKIPGRAHMLDGARLPSVAELVRQYVQSPKALIWTRYLWTADVDRHGQRVFVGDNGVGLEIHRHLTITSRWGAAIYQ